MGLTEKSFLERMEYMGFYDPNKPRTAVAGHGRLIDADALASEMEKQIQKQNELMELCKSAGDTENYFNTYKVQIGMVSFLRALNDAPTIIPADKEEKG